MENLMSMDQNYSNLRLTITTKNSVAIVERVSEKEGLVYKIRKTEKKDKKN